MTLSNIKENRVNVDSNEVASFIGNEINIHSVDITELESVTFVGYDNGIWAVEVKGQTTEVYFTDNIIVTIEGYVNGDFDEEIINDFDLILSIYEA